MVRRKVVGVQSTDNLALPKNIHSCIMSWLIRSDGKELEYVKVVGVQSIDSLAWPRTLHSCIAS